MAEPLTDEEFEARKGLQIFGVIRSDNYVTQNDYDRLVATVNHKQKVMETALVNWDMETGKRQKLEEENAKLKARVERLLNGYKL